MRHAKNHGMKLGSSPSHTRAMKRNLLRSILEHDRIKTTLPRAKAIRGDVDRVITWAKRGDLHARRLAIAEVGDKELVRETFEKAKQGLWDGRDGGYTRIMKLGPRKGDNAEVALIEIVTDPVMPKADATSPKVPTKVGSVKEPEKVEAAEAEADEEMAADDVADVPEDVADATGAVTDAAADAEE